MEQNTNNQQELKSRLIFFFGKNKYTIVFTLLILISIPVVLIFFQIMNVKKNELLSQKFIQAGLYLSSNNLEESRKIYEEIILDKNKFYSLLALNTIIEKNLEKNNQKIFEYFEIIENLGYSDEEKDLFILKKALFFLKMNDKAKSNELLQKLINKKSKYKNLAEDILIE